MGILIFYFGILLLWKILEDPYMKVTTGSAAFLVNITQPRHPVSLKVYRKKIAIVLKSKQAPSERYHRGLYGHWIQSNLVLTAALILATPGLATTRRFKLLFMALVILFGIHVLDMTIQVKNIYMNAYASQTGATYALWQRNLLKGLDRFFQIFRTQFIPFLVWGGLCYRDLFLGSTLRLSPGAKVGRNQPCPCGSGKKYKHCCGKE